VVAVRTECARLMKTEEQGRCHALQIVASVELRRISTCPSVRTRNVTRVKSIKGVAIDRMRATLVLL